MASVTFYRKGCPVKAWVYQDDKQVKKHGPGAASWYVGWIDPEGKKRCKSCGPGPEGRRNAEKLRRKRDAELLTGTYQSNERKTWTEFRQEYEAKIVPGLDPQTGRLVKNALDHFARLVNPVRMAALKAQAIDDYRAQRRQEAGKKPDSLVSPATINKELRHLRAALKKAFKWGYLTRPLDFEFEREPKKLPAYVTPEHFLAIYQACTTAKMPKGRPYPAAAWWQGLLVMAYLTGWRIGELLALRRDDLDLAEGTAVTRAQDNKGGRDERVRLHPVVIEHLKAMPDFDPCVFPWHRNRRTLYAEFARIQRAAGIDLACHEEHQHTPACHVYGFHDSRRAFATMNAGRLTGDVLQALMRHKSYTTTQKYINLARQMNPAVEALFVPEGLKAQPG
jgi:integrase